MTREEYMAGEETPRETVTGGVVLEPDDFQVGQQVCVYNLKKSPDEGHPMMGQSMEIVAICLPFFVVKVLSDPNQPITTLDTRFLNMMLVNKEFVAAQMKGAGGIEPPQARTRKAKVPQPPPEGAQA